MLAVVQHDEHVPAGDDAGERVHCGTPCLVGQPQCARNSERHDVGISDRRQVDVPHPIHEIGPQPGGDLHRQTRLSHAPCPGQRHQTVDTDDPQYLLDFGGAADETGELQWKML